MIGEEERGRSKVSPEQGGGGRKSVIAIPVPVKNNHQTKIFETLFTVACWQPLVFLDAALHGPRPLHLLATVNRMTARYIAPRAVGWAGRQSTGALAGDGSWRLVAGGRGCGGGSSLAVISLASTHCSVC